MAPVRLSLLGVSASAVPLQGTLNSFHEFPGSVGRTYTVTLDTTPSGAQVRVAIADDFDGTSNTLLASQIVTTPFSTVVTPVRSVSVHVRVFDPNQASLTLSTITSLPDAWPFSSTGFDVVIWSTGDSFAGLGYFNDLATIGDKTNLVGDLIGGVGGVNEIFLPTTIQVNLPTAGIGELTNAEVIAVDPSLVNGSGFTVAPDTQAQADNLGSLGAPASDPNFGKHVDVFLVHSPNAAMAGGSCWCGSDTGPTGGGTFVGTGPMNSIVLPLFDPAGNPFPLTSIKQTLAHELGHFLGLDHTTENDFTPDDIPDTPFSDAATYDLNGNGTMDAPGETTGPDIANVMFWIGGFGGPPQVNWTTDQINAMRDLLATRDH